MNPRENDNTTDDAEADAGPSQPIEDYLCVDPEQGMLVFDWLNGFDDEAKETVVLHLRICLHCREAVADWGRLHQLVGVSQAQYTHIAAAHSAAAKDGAAHKAAKTDGTKQPRLKARGSYGGK